MNPEEKKLLPKAAASLKALEIAIDMEPTQEQQDAAIDRSWKHLPTKEPGVKCNARCRNARRGQYCTQPAGMRTDHHGTGRCWLHGGRAQGKRRSKAARYLNVGLGQPLENLIQDLAADQDPLNITPELAALRAIFIDFVSRYDEWREALLLWHTSFYTGKGDPKPRMIMDIAQAASVLEKIARIAQNEKKLRLDGAISRREFEALLKAMWRIVEQHVQNETVQGYIQEDWMRLR